MSSIYQPITWLVDAGRIAAYAVVFVCVLAGADRGAANAADISIKDLTQFVGAAIATGLGFSRTVAGGRLAIETDASENLEISDNVSLEVDPPAGAAVRTTTSLNGTLASEERTRRYDVNANYDHIELSGRGDPGNLDSRNQRYQARFRENGKRLDYNVRAIYSKRSAADAQRNNTTVNPLLDASGEPIFDPSTQLQSTGDTAVDGDQETFSVGGDLTLTVNQRNSLTLTANGSQQTFTGATPGLVDSETITTSAAWTFQPTSTTRFTLNGLRLLQLPGSGGRNVKREIKASVNAQLTRRLNVDAGVGAAFVQGEETLTNGLATADVSEKSVGLVANFGLDYVMKRTSLSFGVARNVSPTSAGDLQLSETARLTVNHDINRRSRAGVRTTYSKQSSPEAFTESAFARDGSKRKLVRILPYYSITLNRKWKMDLEYEYAYEESVSGIATSRSMFFKMNRRLPISR